MLENQHKENYTSITNIIHESIGRNLEKDVVSRKNETDINRYPDAGRSIRMLGSRIRMY